LGKTVQELKKESKIKDNSIKTCLSKDQLNKTHLADLFVANCLELGLKYKEIKDKIIIKTN
jgi:hypothetical protein